MSAGNIIFEQIRSSGCLSYLLGCPEKKKCVVIDPELDKADEYIELAKFFSSELLYAIDTHTHADHNSACKVLREKHGIKVLMHEATDAPYIDVAVKDGDFISFGSQSIKVLYTPGHTQLMVPSASAPHSSNDLRCNAEAITGTSTGVRICACAW